MRSPGGPSPRAGGSLPGSLALTARVVEGEGGGAGVRVHVGGDELPLTFEPGTRPLLGLITCALRPETLDEQAAAELLTGPLGGTDALGLRRLRRGLVAAARVAGQPPPAEPLAGALREPRALVPAG